MGTFIRETSQALIPPRIEHSANPGRQNYFAVFFKRPRRFALLGLVLFFSSIAATRVSLTLGMPLPTCTFRQFIGIPCPFCGSTRLWIALSHGNFSAAWLANPFLLVTSL